ncbi:MAG: class I SAM-dependent methyltransferase [Bryobacteraceae bacterium]
MHEILRQLGSHHRVLDLGCASGSFPDHDSAATVVRADLERPSGKGLRFVRCDARSLPFAEHSFDAVILNHSLEHFENPASVLAEVRRILRSPAFLYVAVPDAATITDRVYRWLGRGGGHVNQFIDATALVKLIGQQTALAHVGTRLLFTSLSFLNRHNIQGRRPRRLYLLGGGSEWVLRLGTFLMRWSDGVFGTRFAIYGWACCFGPALDFDTRPWSNVCVRCGSGHASELLLASAKMRRGLLGARLYCCPSCGVENYFTEDSAYLAMR